MGVEVMVEVVEGESRDVDGCGGTAALCPRGPL